MRQFTIVCAWAVAAAGFVEPLAAQISNFPYSAVVEADELFVRSGPGKKYYPTAKLAKGQGVVVHRHDPGGWYMIAPPAGSFSWIAADAVQPLEAGRGLVAAPEAAVRVGSAFADTHDVEQSRLSKNAEVQILGEKTLQTEDGAVRMLKIAPPHDEHRWIEGRFITPVDPQVRQQNDRDPFAFPTQAKKPAAPVPANPVRLEAAAQPLPAEWSAGGAVPGSAGADQVPADDAFTSAPAVVPAGEAAIRRGPTPAETHADRVQLDVLDAQLREMADGGMAAWDFSALETEYRRLGERTSQAVVAQLIGTRLLAIEHYRTIKAEYDHFVRLTSETTRRDAELASMQQAVMTRAAPPIAPIPETSLPAAATPVETVPVLNNAADPFANAPRAMPVASDAAVAGPTLAGPTEPEVAAPAPTVAEDGFLPPIVIGQRSPTPVTEPADAGTPAIPVSTPTIQPIPANAAPEIAPPTATGPKFDGAGLIQQAKGARPGFPQHVLVAPDGRVLAWLQAAPGIELDRHIGQSLGVVGQRGYRPDLQADLIMVRDLVPVKLLP